MKDRVFGWLHYGYGWNGSVRLDWSGREEDVDLMISGEEEDGISDYQRECFTAFMNAWPALQTEVPEQIFRYYRKLSEELGYGDGSHPDYPRLSQASEIKEHIHPDQISIFEEGIFEGRCVGLAFSCTWDDENGCGVLLINEHVEEIGYQDLVF
ncbi:MAG: DUF6985 domain-containing protein [bacterium]